jgi:hypothetical protein
MSQMPCNRCDPGPMRWLHAGGDLAQPNPIHPSTNCPLMHSKRAPKCLMHSPNLICVQTSRWCRPGTPPIIEIGASIKTP